MPVRSGCLMGAQKVAVAEEDLQVRPVWVARHPSLPLALGMVECEARTEGPLPHFWHLQN